MTGCEQIDAQFSLKTKSSQILVLRDIGVKKKNLTTTTTKMTGEMVLQLGVLVAVAEDSDSIVITHMVVKNHQNSSSRGFDAVL